MNYKQIMISLATIVAVGAVVAGATGAFYNDTETSENNIFTAGSVDLKVDHLKQTYNGIDCETCSVTLESDANTLVTDGDPDNDYPYNAIVVAEEDEADDWAQIDGVDWIWGEAGRPGPEDNTTYTFEETFEWFGTVEEAFIEFDLAADDDFTIWLNGEEVTSDTAAWQDTQEISLDPSDFEQGENTLTFEVTNSGAYYAGLLYELTIQRDSEECAQDGSFQQVCQLWSETDLDGSQTFFNFGDIKPGDRGTNVISLHSYDNDAYSCLVSHNGVDEENGVMDPETDLGDDDSEGELQDYIEFFAWIDGEGDVNPDGQYNPNDEQALGISTLGELNSVASLDDGFSLTGTSTAYIGLEWCAGNIAVDDQTGDVSCDGNGMLNDAQSDSYESSLTAYAVQTRNNDNFSCADLAPEDLNPELPDVQQD